MSEIVIAGRAIPVSLIAVVPPGLALVYVLAVFLGLLSEEGMMARLERLDAKDQEIAQKKEEVNELERRAREVERVKNEIAALEKSITLLKQKIPAEAQVPILLFDIERIAHSGHAELKSFAPQKAKAIAEEAPAALPPGEGGAEGEGGASAPNSRVANAMADIQEIPVAIKADATFGELIAFLRGLDQYERKLNISDISLTSGKGPGVVETKAGAFKNALNVEFTLSAFVLKRGAAQP